MVFHGWAFAAILFAPFVLAAGASLIAGSLVYRGRMARRARRQAYQAPVPDDPVVELVRVGNEIAESLAEARFMLERTRGTLEKGLKG